MSKDLKQSELDIHNYWMDVALEQAKQAEALGEVPIGAVIVRDNVLIAKAHNLRELEHLATAHAELLAIQNANIKLGHWRLADCTLYVTLEPCPMCSGAIIMSRLARVVYGAQDPKSGCVGSLMNLLTDQRFNHQPEVIAGVRGDETSQILKDFFKKLRKRKVSKKTHQQVVHNSVDNYEHK